jgi:DNA-binding winged helix-turn-helix (wHTH) protein
MIESAFATDHQGGTMRPADAKVIVATHPLLAFGPFVADPFLGILRNDGATVPLTPKAFEVLIALLERRGELVEKDELLQRVWPNTVVEENNLARHISTLRKVFNDQSPEHHYIVTVSGRGYRFVAPVREIPRTEESEIPVPPLQGDAAGGGSPIYEPPPVVVPELPRAYRLRAFAAGALLVVMAAAVAGIVIMLRRPEVDAAPAPRRLLQFTFGSGLQNEPTWSPDGQRIAYASDRGGNFDIWTQAIDTSLPRV